MYAHDPGSPQGSRHARRMAAVLASLCITLAWVRIAGANWPFNSNVNVPLCTAVHDQGASSILADGNGGAFVVWSDARNDTTNYDIYAQHVAGSGLVDQFWPADGQPICTGDGIKSARAIISDGAGGAIIVWSNLNLDANQNGVYVQRVGANGATQWAANGVAICIVPLVTLGSVAAVPDGAGGAIVTWIDDRNNTGNWSVFAQRVNAAGVPQWTPNGVLVCAAADIRTVYGMVADGSGGAIIDWQDRRNGVDYDVYAQKVDANGVPKWSSNGVAVCTGANDQRFPRAATDGAGGAIITWEDDRNGTDFDVYAQRVDAAGVNKWAPGGVGVCVAPFDEHYPVIVSDAAGGAVIIWADHRIPAHPIYAQHVSPNGSTSWAANGVSLTASNSILSFTNLSAAADGAGGAIVTWVTGGSDIAVQRVLASGQVPVSWPANGRMVCTAPDDQGEPVICSDGGARAIVAWDDHRNGTDYDVYCQLIAPSGFLAVPNPLLMPIHDVPWDQGGLVDVQWDASYLDTVEPFEVDHYWVLRTAPPELVSSAIEQGHVLAPEQLDAALDPAGGGTGRWVVLTGSGANAFYWEPLQRIAALHTVADYSVVAPTTTDSTAAGNPLTAFMVIAYDPTGTIALPSDPESGYSVDNPPRAPMGLSANLVREETQLHWNPNSESDLARYHLYRGGAPDFVPGPASLIASTQDTAFTDIGSGPSGSYYKLSAVDIAGNESEFALLSTVTTTAVGADPTPELSLSRPSPNPARGSARIGFSLPSSGRVSLEVYDVAGRVERRLIEDELPAGAHTQVWDLRDGAGSLASAGLYFVRLEAAGRRLTQRLVVAGP